MSDSAKVESVDALRSFKIALIKFVEGAGAAVADADGDLSRTLNWLEGEQSLHWKNALRKAHEDVERAKEAVRMKKLYKNADGTYPSTVEEEKVLKTALRRQEYVEHKVEAVRRSIPILTKQALLFKGAVTRLTTALRADVPMAASKLDQYVAQIESYVELSANDIGTTTMESSSEATSAPPPADSIAPKES